MGTSISFFLFLVYQIFYINKFSMNEKMRKLKQPLKSLEAARMNNEARDNTGPEGPEREPRGRPQNRSQNRPQNRPNRWRNSGHKKLFKRRRNFLYGEMQKQRFGLINGYRMVRGIIGRRSVDECGRINFPGMTGLSAKQHRANVKLIKRARSTNQLLPYVVRIRSLYRRYRFWKKGLGAGLRPWVKYKIRMLKIRRRRMRQVRRWRRYQEYLVRLRQQRKIELIKK